jgi:hypothetical protein
LRRLLRDPIPKAADQRVEARIARNDAGERLGVRERGGTCVALWRCNESGAPELRTVDPERRLPRTPRIVALIRA